MTLLREQPFFGFLVQYLTITETDRIPTAAITEHAQMFYNPDFIDSLTSDEVEAVFAHEVMHPVMKGFLRQNSRDGQRWNIAQDLVINHILKHKNDFEFPEEIEVSNHDGETVNSTTYVPNENGTYESPDGEWKITDIGDRSFEDVYAQVPDDPDTGQGMDQHITEEDIQQNNTPIPQEMFERGDEQDWEERDWDSLSSQAAQKSMSQGIKPGGFEQLIETDQDSEVDYRELIKHVLEDHTPSDYTFMRRSKAGRSVGVHLPATDNEGNVEVIVSLDTSGSVSDELLEYFIAEIKSLISSYPQVELHVIQHDSKVQKVDHYHNATESDFNRVEIKGRGGTNHTPVFEHIQEEMTDLDSTVLINLTDGFTTVPDDAEGIDDIIWILNNHEVTLERLKHGRITHIDPEMS